MATPVPIEIERIGTRARRITAPGGISAFGNAVAVGNDLWTCINAYRADGTYQVVYLALGGVDRAIVEDQGLLPVVFAGPDRAAWAIVTNPYGPRDREIVRAVGGAAVGEPHAPFVGDPLWLDGDTLVMVNTHPYDNAKPDRWMSYDTKSGKRKTVKLPLPARARYLRNEQGIHSFARGEHRLLDPAGAVLRERTLDELRELMISAVDLRFDGDSVVIGADRTTLWWMTIRANGAIERTQLLEGSFYNLWPIEHLGDGLVAWRHNGEHGNGWAIAKDGALVSAARSDERGYVDQRGDRVIELPSASWILAGLVAVAGALVVVAYPEGRASNALWVVTVAEAS